MTDNATEALLDDFLTRVRAELPLAALWAHGSLGGGDYVEGRSDLDLIALLDEPPGSGTGQRVARLHRALAEDHPLAARLHCGYLAPDAVGDPARDHLTWAHEELKSRPVTEVTRRELHESGRVLYGVKPGERLPTVTDDELAAHILRDLSQYWRSALAHPVRWMQDIWVDLGMLTLARATVTLTEGRLTTKREALDVLAELGAPEEVVADIRARRYGGEHVTGLPWRARRAVLTRTFLRPALDRTVERYGPPPGTGGAAG